MAVLYVILALLAILVIAAVVLLYTKMRLIISVGSGGLYIKVCKFGFSYTVPLDKTDKADKKEEKKEAISNEDSIMKRFLDMRNNFMRQKKAVSVALSYLRGRIYLNEVGIIGKFGTGNPVTGGIAYGSVCGFVNTVIAFSGQFFVVEKPPVIDVKFKAQESVIEIKAAFLVDAKLIDIIKALLKYKKILTKGTE